MYSEMAVVIALALQEGRQRETDVTDIRIAIGIHFSFASWWRRTD